MNFLYGCIDLTMLGVLVWFYVIWWSDHVTWTIWSRAFLILYLYIHASRSVLFEQGYLKKGGLIGNIPPIIQLYEKGGQSVT